MKKKQKIIGEEKNTEGVFEKIGTFSTFFSDLIIIYFNSSEIFS